MTMTTTDLSTVSSLSISLSFIDGAEIRSGADLAKAWRVLFTAFQHHFDE